MVNIFFLVLFFCLNLWSVEVPFSQLSNLKDINGNILNAEKSKDYQILYFWATWCPSCKEKMKGPLNEIVKNYNVEIRLINTDKDLNMVKNFVSREAIKLPVYMDTDKSLRLQFDVNPVPHWVLLKKDKSSFKVLASEVGWDWDKIKPLITKID
jgi:thiol-disulfide isomerase/thioredoxin